MKKILLDKKYFPRSSKNRKIFKRSGFTALILIIGFLMSIAPQKISAQQCKKPFVYTGADQTFTVPLGITSITIKAWGAGGGGGNSVYYNLVAGGAGGGYSTGTLAVNPGDVLTIRVGKGGITSSAVATFGGGGAGGTAAQNGGSGGGLAGVFIGSTPVLIAGGGGGGSPGADTLNPFAGGGGGTTGGQDAVAVSGKGGTQSTGGAEGIGGNNGIAGSYLIGGKGGNGGSSSNEGGGGGGGYYGGGGGAGQGPNYNGGGGGGSSYIGYSALTATSTTAGANGAFNSVGGAAANTADADYAAGVGNGLGAGGPGTAGGNGRVVIIFSRTISGNNTICSGTTSQLTVSPSVGAGEAWVSSNTAVATVSSTGLVTAVAAGSATITYTDSGVCTVPFAITVPVTTAITTQPITTQTVAQNATPTNISVTAAGAALTYQWYSNATNSNTGGTAITGATSSTYTPPTTVTGIAYYYSVMTGTCGVVTSNTSAVITMVAPILTKSVSPASIVNTGTATYTFTIDNTATGNIAQTGVSFTDALPSGLRIAATPGVVVTGLTGGTTTATAGGAAITTTGYSIAAGAMATIKVNVTNAAGQFNASCGANPAAFTNGAANITSKSANLTNNVSNVCLTVLQAQTSLTKSIAPATIVDGGTAVYTFTVSNTATGNTAQTGISFTDALPSGLKIAATPGVVVTGLTAGTTTAAAGGTNIIASGYSIAAGATGTIKVNVTNVAGQLNASCGANPAAFTNGATNITSTSVNVTNNVGDVCLTVTPQAVLTKSISPTTIVNTGTATYTFTIDNSANGSTALTGIAFTDALPSGLRIATTPGVVVTGLTGGTTTAAAGGITITTTGYSIAPGVTATITVNVTNAAGQFNASCGANPAAFTNGSTNITSKSANLTNNVSNVCLTVLQAQTSLTKSVSPATIIEGGTATYTFTVANTATGNTAQTGISFADALPSGLKIAATPGVVVTGLTVGTTAAAAGGTTITASGYSIAAGATGTIKVNVTNVTGQLNASCGANPAAFTNGAANITSTSTNVTNNVSDVCLTVQEVQTSLTKSVYPVTFVDGGMATYTFTISNTATGNTAKTGVSFTDNLPTSLRIAPTPGVVITGLTGGTTTATAGDTAITATGYSIAAGATGTITVNVTNVAGQLNASCGANPAAFTNGATNITSTSANLINNVSNVCLTVTPVVNQNCTVPAVVKPFTMVKNSSSTANNMVSSSVSVGDLDNDGLPEIVAVASSSGYRIYEGDGSNFAHTSIDVAISLPVEAYAAGVNVQAALGNIDKIGNSEIVSVDNAGKINVFRYVNKTTPATFLFKSTESVVLHTSPKLVDINEDGIPEVVVGNAIFKFNPTFTGLIQVVGINSSNPAGAAGYYWDNDPVIMDVLKSIPGKEFIAGSKVYSVDFTAGTLVLQRNLNTIAPAIPNNQDGRTSVADMDLDGDLDIVYTRVGGLVIWDPTEQKLLLNASVGSTSAGIPFIANVYDDVAAGKAKNYPEAVFITQSNVYAFNLYKTTPLWSFAHSDNSATTTLNAFDFNGDGVMEMVYKDETTLRILNGNTLTPNTLASVPNLSLTWAEGPIIADVDNDGEVEIVVVNGNTNGPLEIYGAGPGTRWTAGRTIWNQRGYHITNVNDDLTIPTAEQNSLAQFPAGSGIQTLNSYMAQSPPTADLNLPVGFVRAADLSVDATSSFQSASTCPNLTIDLKIYNGGSTGYSNSLSIQVYSSDPKIAGAVLLNTYTQNVVIPASTTITLPLSVTLATIPPGTLYYVINTNNATVVPITTVPDFDNSVPECSFDNNFFQISTPCGGVCYNNANTAVVGLDSNHGITTLQRAGADNGNWPMIRKSAYTVLESNTKGFVITRMTTAQISAIISPQEGMMVYDIDAKCLKINSDSTTTGWSCYNAPACP